MNLHEYRLLFVTVVAIVTLLVAFPALGRVLVYPRTEFFTELWLLGPNHMAEGYPFNVTRGQTYGIYLGVANHLGYSAHYVVEVKFRNSTQLAPSSFGPISNLTTSNLPSLYNISAFVADEYTWELPVKFSFDYSGASLSTLQMHSLTLNDVFLNMSHYSIAWDSQRNEFWGSLFFELWVFNATTNNFQYHARWVGLQLNMTV